MKIYLRNHSDTMLPGHTSDLESQLRTHQIQIIETISEADLILVVLDYKSPHTEIFTIAQSIQNRPIWVYIPRGKVIGDISEGIAEAINAHISYACSVGIGAVQRVYTYDVTTDIVSWVLRRRFDMKIELRALRAKILDNLIRRKMKLSTT